MSAYSTRMLANSFLFSSLRASCSPNTFINLFCCTCGNATLSRQVFRFPKNLSEQGRLVSVQVLRRYTVVCENIRILVEIFPTIWSCMYWLSEDICKNCAHRICYFYAMKLDLHSSFSKTEQNFHIIRYIFLNSFSLVSFVISRFY